MLAVLFLVFRLHGMNNRPIQFILGGMFVVLYIISKAAKNI
jgi:hypothetical protein